MGQDGFGTVHNHGGHPRQTCHLDAVGLVRRTLHDLAQEDDLLFPFADGHIVILHARPGTGQIRQLMVMRGEQRAGLQLVMQVLRHGPRDGKTVKGSRAAPDLIQNNQGTFRGVIQNQGRLAHLHHEGGLAARQIIAGAHAAENAVHQPHTGGFRRNVGAYLGHQRNQGHLPYIGALACHIRASQQN